MLFRYSDKAQREEGWVGVGGGGIEDINNNRAV